MAKTWLEYRKGQVGGVTGVQRELDVWRAITGRAEIGGNEHPTGPRWYRQSLPRGDGRTGMPGDSNGTKSKR